MLTHDQRAFFDREGYLVVPDVFPPGGLNPLKDELTAIVHREAMRLHEQDLISAIHENEPFDRRLACIHQDRPEAAEAIIAAITGKGGGGHSGRAMFEAITHPGLLAYVEDIVGPEIVGSSVYRIRPKVPGLARGVVPWHQDSGYFSAHCDESLILTCWIALVDATPDNGCLQVIPRAHGGPVLEHRTGGPGGYLVIPDSDLPPGAPVIVPVPEGGVLFLTNRTPHASIPNVTEQVRWSIDVRYQSADVPNNVGKPPEAYAPGLPPGEIACYPPEADFIVQSRIHPGRALRSWTEFDAIRRRYQDNRPAFRGRWTRGYAKTAPS